MKYHPYRGGDTETMKRINAEYDEMFALLKAAHNTTEAPEEFRNIIDYLMKLDGLEIELCGSWLWIGGNTKAHKDELKKAGCRWSNNKKLWYWHHAEEGHHWRKGGSTKGQIRTKYGSQVFKGSQEESNYERLGATA